MTRELPVKMRGLPIVEVLPALMQALHDHDQAILHAPPGAGKTTLVPIALEQDLDLQGRKILMLEPRRIAARAAAERMAQLLGEAVGERVGYRVRFDSKVSARTRIEVVTEGILNRLLHDDPSLDAYALVIFDEFHERNLDADLGLALTLQARQLFRTADEQAAALKVLVMSATLDDHGLADILAQGEDAVPVVESEGRQFPVAVHYDGVHRYGEPIAPRVIETCRDVLVAHSTSVLVFLPGRAEIHQVQHGLEQWLNDEGHDSIDVTPLYGDLSLNDQRQAVEAAREGRRKVVLATSLAESSLTIEGVGVVIDAGLMRVPAFDPNTGMTRLHTKRVSKAGSEQRTGRAGRLAPGECYRLWSKDQHEQLNPYSEPEILHADLAPLVLQLHCWGVAEPSELNWLTSPPAGAYEQARTLLVTLGALSDRDAGWHVTEMGEAMNTLPAHPRLAHMLCKAKALGMAEDASRLAALLNDRDPFSREETNQHGADLDARMRLFETGARMRRHLKQAQSQFLKILHALKVKTQTRHPSLDLGVLLAFAFPDRIARRHATHHGRFQLANGRIARLAPHDPLADAQWLVCANLGGVAGQKEDRIFLAARFNPDWLDGVLSDLVRAREVCEWDERTERFVAERQWRVGGLVWQREPLHQVPQEQHINAVIGLVRRKGLQVLPWNDTVNTWRARIEWIRQHDSEHEWPNLSDAHLIQTMNEWLAPYLSGVRHIKHFAQLDLKSILSARIPWALQSTLEEQAPERIRVPSGSQLRIDYTQSPPILAVRLQEMFGCTQTPRIANGRCVLKLHLLTPAQRPLAVTQDLASFWVNAYPEVKKEYKGRYPKHYWPDDPLQAEATRRAKPRPPV